MAEIRTVTTLRSKRDEVAAAIDSYERRLEQARADLSHLNATIAIFEASGAPGEMASYVDIHRLFKRGEAMLICKAALTAGPMSTRQLATHVMASKGFDIGDKVLAKSVGYTLILCLRMQCHRGAVKDCGKIKGVRIWSLPGCETATMLAI